MLLPKELVGLYAPVREELDQAFEQVSAIWTEVLRLGNGKVDHSPPKAGGKLLRPALCLLSAGAIGAGDLSRFIPMAASMEIFHLAALAHDDVIDGADLRRGETTLKALWNDRAAVLGGDYLVARGMALLTSYNSCQAVTGVVECMGSMAEAELADFALGPWHFSFETCLSLAQRKTALLFGVVCSTPAYILDGRHRESLYRFGLGLGSAFQLVDDLLDLRQEEAILGKPVCGDLMKGKKTLPILFIREALEAGDVTRLDSIRGRPLTPEDRKWAAEILESTGARQRTEAIARQFAHEARQALGSLPPSPYKASMEGLAEFVLIRDS